MFFLLDCFKIIQSRGLSFSTIFLPQVLGFCPGGWSGLELTATLVLGIARTVSRLRSQVNLSVFDFLRHEEFSLKIFKINQTEVASDIKVFTRH